MSVQIRLIGMYNLEKERTFEQYIQTTSLFVCRDYIEHTSV